MSGANDSPDAGLAVGRVAEATGHRAEDVGYANKSKKEIDG